MKASFTAHKLTSHERLWIETALTLQPADVRVLKVKLHGKIPTDFDGSTIDSRIWSQRRLTLIGRWVMNPKDPILSDVEQVVQAIRREIFTRPGLENLSAKELATATGFDESRAARALYYVTTLPGFSAGSVGVAGAPEACASISLGGDTGYDAYLKYAGLRSSLEGIYRANAPKRGRRASPAFDPFSGMGNWGAVEAIPPVAIKRRTAFVLMAINPQDPSNEDFYRAIKETCAMFGIRAYRADDIEHQGAITDRVLEEIQTCEYLIADLTGERPNVYYEIGYAHALDKNPILLRKDGTKLHFDISVHNAPTYKNATELRAVLSKRWENILGRGPRSRSKLRS